MTKHCTKSNLKPLSDDEAMNDFDFTAFISQSLLNAPFFLNLNKVFHQLEQISVVFHQYETGVRSGTIRPGVGLVSSIVTFPILCKTTVTRCFKINVPDGENLRHLH